MAYETRDLQVKITGDASSFSKSINNVEESSKNASVSFGKMSLAVAAGNAIWDGAKTAMKSIVDTASGVIKAAIDEQERIAQTNAVLKSTAGVAGLTSSKITELAESFARTTPFSDDVVRSAENLLLTFTNIGKDVFPQATETVLNMAQALGEDTSSAAIQLGKALQDPILGITALRRVGVNFSDAQKEVVKHMVATGNSAGAQALILKELQTEFGGSAKAAGETFGGQLKILGNDIDMMKESIGGAILTAIEPFIQKLVAWAATPDAQDKIQEITKWVAEMAGKMAKWVTDVAIPWVTKYWPDIQKSLKAASDQFNDFMKVINASGQVFKILGLLIWGMCDGIANFIYTTQVIIGGVINGVRTFVHTAVSIVTGAFNGLVCVANAIGSSIRNAIMGAINGVVGGVKWVLNGLIDIVNTAIGGINAVTGNIGVPKIPSIQHLARGGIVGGNPSQGDNVLVAATSGEMVLNKSQQTNLLNILNSGKSDQIPSITVNVGMYAGMPVEKREIALSMYRELVRAARSQGVNMPMIGAVGVQ